MQLTRVRRSFQALGGDIELALVTIDQADGEAKLVEMCKHVLEFEKRFSRFLFSSELSKLNARAGQKVAVSQDFIDLLKATRVAAHNLGGLYNPFMLPAVHRSGYVTSKVEKYRHQAAPDYSNRFVAPLTSLETGEDWVRIPFGTAIDIGGIGKGYLADWLVGILDKTIRGYWFNLSGDIAVGGTDEYGQELTVDIQSALDRSKVLDHYRIDVPHRGVGVATSGQLPVRSEDTTNHHLIDPRTLEPCDSDVRLVTVVAPSATLADVLASAAVIVGSKDAHIFLRQHGALSWLIQTAEDTTLHGKHIVGTVKERAYA